MRSPSIVHSVMIIQILLNTDNNVYTTDYAHALKRKSKFKHKMKLLKTTYTIKQDTVEEAQTLRTSVRGGGGVKRERKGEGSRRERGMGEGEEGRGK